MDIKVFIIIFLILFSLYSGRNMRNNWYDKPDIQPPNWVFPVVWTTLYVSLVYLYITNKRNDVFILIVVSLILQSLWLYLFNPENYKLSRWVLVAIVICALLLVSRVKNWRFLAFLYLLWVSFATILNFKISVK